MELRMTQGGKILQAPGIWYIIIKLSVLKDLYD